MSAEDAYEAGLRYARRGLAIDDLILRLTADGASEEMCLTAQDAYFDHIGVFGSIYA